MRIALERQSERAGQAEVRDFDLGLALIDQEVGRLEVTVHDPALVAVQQALQHLPDDRASLGDGHGLAAAIEILLHVEVEKLEDQVELVVAVNDVEQVDDGSVAELTEEGDLADGRAGNAFV